MADAADRKIVAPVLDGFRIGVYPLQVVEVIMDTATRPRNVRDVFMIDELIAVVCSSWMFLLMCAVFCFRKKLSNASRRL